MIELYHKTACPYCAKVRKFIDEKGFGSKIQYHETETEPGAKANLESLTQKTQVPCLVVAGKPMLESDAIIQWLDKNLH